MMLVNPDRSQELIDSFLIVWENSVRASHFFLTEEAIDKLIPIVESALREIEILVVAEEEGKRIAFMGIQENKIEMLFVSPDHFGKQIGTNLIIWAINKFDVKFVDVNEQNEKALGFYLRFGFQIFERMETDDFGNPYPILKMMLSD